MDKRIAHILHRGDAERFREWAELARSIPGGSGGMADALDSVAFALEPDSPNKQWMNADKLPFTVLVEDTQSSTNGYHNHVRLVMAMNPNEAGLLAIDSIIDDAGLLDEEDDGVVDHDTYRADFKCIAIYEGHLTNFVQ